MLNEHGGGGCVTYFQSLYADVSPQEGGEKHRRHGTAAANIKRQARPPLTSLPGSPS